MYTINSYYCLCGTTPKLYPTALMFVRSTVALMLACFVSSDDKLYNSYLKLVYTSNGLVLLSKFALLL